MAKSAASKRRPARPRDIALVLDRTEDLEGFQILRRRAADRPLELGTIRPLREGQPIDGEVLSLKPRRDVPFIYDVKVQLPDQKPHAARQGPPQVASPEYRRGWDAIWGRAAARASAGGAKPN